MSGNTTHTTQALIRAENYSGVILDELTQGFLPEGITRDVSDFPDGTKLLIPTFGEVVIKDIMEDQDTPIDTIDTGRIEMEITEHTGGGAYITDELREDAYYISQFDAAFPGKALHSLKEVYETDMLSTGEKNQVLGDPNAINKFAHRYAASGAGGALTLMDFAYARTAMLKAKTPDSGMIAIVDPVTELTVNGLTNISNVSNNPHFEGIVESGFSKNMKFLKNIYGIDVYLSDRLARVESETINTDIAGLVTPRDQQGAGAVTVTDGYAAMFMNVTDDMTMPFMSAWRRQPKVEYNRDTPKRRDEYYITSRYGFAMQRPQSLVTVVASCENY